MRTSTVNRKTSETDISLTINIDGSGKSEIRTGNGFFDHMLVLLARHARFDLNVNCIGDIGVDFHHSAEDIGICLGQAFKNALGDKRGVTRYAHTVLPMDEALILAAVDISGRSHLTCELSAVAACRQLRHRALRGIFWRVCVKRGCDLACPSAVR